MTVLSSSELFICTSSRLIRFEKFLNNLTSLRGGIKRYYERGGAKDCGMNGHRKLQHCSELAHNVCTESVRSGGTSAAKS